MVIDRLPPMGGTAIKTCFRPVFDAREEFQDWDPYNQVPSCSVSSHTFMQLWFILCKIYKYQIFLFTFIFSLVLQYYIVTAFKLVGLS